MLLLLLENLPLRRLMPDESRWSFGIPLPHHGNLRAGRNEASAAVWPIDSGRLFDWYDR